MAKPADQTSETIHKPTPNGGVKSTAFYQDAQGQPTTKDKAVKVEIVEYDAHDNPIHRTYMTTK